MPPGARTRLTPEQKIAALEQEIADRKAKAEAKARTEAGTKKHQLDQAYAKVQLANDAVDTLEAWFNDNGIDPESVTAVAPVKKEKAEQA